MLASPCRAQRVGGRETRRVIDHVTAAECRSLQHEEAQIARREQALRIVHRLQGLALFVREVGLVPIAALLQNEDVLAARRQLGGDDAATRTRSHDDDITRECRVACYPERANRLRCVGRRTQWTWIADRATDSGRRIVRDRREPFERLECFAALRDPAGRPTAQKALPFSPRHRREWPRDSAQETIQ